MDIEKKPKSRKKEVEARLLLEARQEIAVLDYLEKFNGTIDGISQATNIPVNRVSSILKTYRGMGMIRKVGITWRLTSLNEKQVTESKTQLTLFRS